MALRPLTKQDVISFIRAGTLSARDYMPDTKSYFSHEKVAQLTKFGIEGLKKGWGARFFVATEDMTVPEFRGSESITVIAEPGVRVKTTGHNTVLNAKISYDDAMKYYGVSKEDAYSYMAWLQDKKWSKKGHKRNAVENSHVKDKRDVFRATARKTYKRLVNNNLGPKAERFNASAERVTASSQIAKLRARRQRAKMVKRVKRRKTPKLV